MNPYLWFIRLRDQLYSRKYIQAYRTAIPVISVGNLNTGGSGKTPFIRYLVEEIQNTYPEKKIVIISKSYKASLTKPQEVTPDDVHQVSVFGDEPCLLKSFLKNVDVWSGPMKYKTLTQALKNKRYDLVIVDDGFSHLKIRRDLDIVLFDVSREKTHYRLFPLGFMREPWEALKRSDLVVLTKTENQEDLKVKSYVKKIQKFQKNIISANFSMELQDLKKEVFLLTGIGNPQGLIQNLEQAGIHILKKYIYPDHFAFPLSEQQKVWSELSALKSWSRVDLVTTQKDLIKFTHADLKNQARVIDLSISMPASDRKILNEKVSQLF